MQLHLDIRGYSYIPDAAFPEIQAAVARLVACADAAGFPLRVDCVGRQPDTEPTVTSIEPTSAMCGGPDLTMHVAGTGFTEASVILFNGGEEVTVYVSPTELTTIVKPSLASVSVSVPVSVVGATTAVDFTFATPPEPPARASAAAPSKAPARAPGPTRPPEEAP